MATTLRFRRGTTAEVAAITGAEGEILIDTTKDTITVHDGVTAGGKTLATELQVNDRMQVANAIATFATTAAVNDRMQVANVNSINTTLTASVNDRMQVANTVLLVNDRMQVANVTSAISTAISNLVDTAPDKLDTLNELAAALNDDENFAATVATNLGQRLGATATVTLTGAVTASQTAFSSNAVSLTTSIAENAVGTTQLNVSGTGTVGQALISDGDGSMSWGAAGDPYAKTYALVGI